jgi:predicted GIY-YIG superfamily endonuclease
MERIVIPGEEKKGRIPTDQIHLQHELIRIKKEIKRLNNRRRDIESLLGSDRLPESYFNKTIHLYALKLQGGNYYIGMTRNVKKRFDKHLKGKGATWTKKYKPIEIHFSRDTKLTNETEVAILENELTYQYALQYGLDKVRGGGYCQVKPTWPQHLYDTAGSNVL